MEKIIELKQNNERIYPLSNSQGVLLSNTSSISLYDSIYSLKGMISLFSSKAIDDFVNTTWVQTENGIQATGIGEDNYIKLDKNYFCDIKHTRLKLSIGSDNKLIFAFSSKNIGQGVVPSKFYIDMQNKKIGMHKLKDPLGYAEYVLSDVWGESDMPLDFAAGEYIFEIIKSSYKSIIRLTDYLTGKSCELICDDTIWSVGAQNGPLYIYLENGAEMPVIKSLDVFTLNNPDIVFVGDSITEGSCVEDLRYRVGELFRIEHPNHKVMISARGGCTIAAILSRFKDEFNIYKPKKMVVNIGANGGNTKGSFDGLKQKCDDIGCTLYLCYNVCYTSTVEERKHQYVNSMIEEWSILNNIEGARFDIATAANNNPVNDESQLPNEDLFSRNIQPYNLHPNKAGQIEMYKRLPIDLPNMHYLVTV